MKRFNSTNQKGSILRFNYLYGFWSTSLLSQLELFKVLVFGKGFFNLIKLTIVCFIYFFFILLFFISLWFFVSFVFTGVLAIPPKRKLPLPLVGVCVWVSFRVRARIEEKFSSGDNCPRTVLPVEKKEIFCMPKKC